MDIYAHCKLNISTYFIYLSIDRSIDLGRGGGFRQRESKREGAGREGGRGGGGGEERGEDEE